MASLKTKELIGMNRNMWLVNFVWEMFNILLPNHQPLPMLGVSIHWTGPLDWNTGLNYWTEVFSFFVQDSVVFWFTPNI